MSGYLARVRRSMCRLILLLSVLFMPLGMAPPVAAAHPGADSTVRMNHCADQHSKHGQTGSTECTMACAAALPVAERREIAPIAAKPAVIEPQTLHRLHGLHPETSTPPPRFP